MEEPLVMTPLGLAIETVRTYCDLGSDVSLNPCTDIKPFFDGLGHWVEVVNVLEDEVGRVVSTTELEELIASDSVTIRDLLNLVEAAPTRVEFQVRREVFAALRPCKFEEPADIFSGYKIAVSPVKWVRMRRKLQGVLGVAIPEDAWSELGGRTNHNAPVLDQVLKFVTDCASAPMVLVNF